MRWISWRCGDQLVLEEAAQWPADLIVLGTHGRWGISRIVLGSTAERILRQSSAPVLLVRCPEAPTALAAEAGSRDVRLPSAALAFERAG